jgi:hypothetical protein
MTARHKALLLLLPLLAVAFLISFYRITSLDVFWHIKTGQVILETGNVLTTNTFSGTYPDHPWPNPEWLFQVTVAALHDAGGWPAVTLFKVTVVLLLTAALYASALVAGGSLPAAVSVTVLALSALQFRFTVRPHLLSYLFLAFTVFVTERHRRMGGRLVWVLPPLFALWSNIHPELFIGLLFLGAIIVGDILNGQTDRSLIYPTLLCVPATLLNPESYHVLIFPFLHIFLGPVGEVEEYVWSSLPMAPLFWVFLVCISLVLFLQRRERAWREIISVGGVAVLGVLWLRATPYLFIVGAPVLASRLGRFRKGRSSGYAELAAVVAAAAALTWAIGFESPSGYRWGWGVMERHYPVAAADLLSTGRFPPTLFNNYGDGSYLIYRLHPTMGVFQDGRLQAYPREFVSRLNARFSVDDLPAILREYGVNTALVERSQVGAFSGREWGLVFWDDSWAILVRRAEAHVDLLEDLEYRTFLPGVDIGALMNDYALGRLAVEMERNQSSRRLRSPVIDSNLGTVYLRLDRRAEAEGAFLRTLDAAPYYAPAWANLGTLYLAAGDERRAVEALEEAVRIDPSLAGAAALLDQIQGGQDNQ